jgi:ferredoxin
MKCGRCAVICPTQAIPTTAPKAAHLNAYRNLNKRNCASGAERLGIKPLYLNLEQLVTASPMPDVDRIVAHRYWKDFWQSVNNKLGAFAACFECFYVCPVGDKDFRKIIALKYRKLDLPAGTIKRQFTDDTVAMVWLGVPEERKAEYERDKDFADLLPI